MNYTKTYHTTAYPSISPSLPSLSAVSKTVLIVGASSGIAQETARAFLEAGCLRLALVSRWNNNPNSNPKPNVVVAKLRGEFPRAQIEAFAADICDRAALEAAFVGARKAFAGSAEGGEKGKIKIDVVINCAGYQPTLAPLAKIEARPTSGDGQAQAQQTDLKEWWRGFEINVLGAATLAQVIASHAGSSLSTNVNSDTSESESESDPETGTGTGTGGVVLLQLGTAGALFPAQAQMPMSGYAVSKLALVKLMEYFGAENPSSLRVVTVHPGIVPTTEGGKKMVRESGVEWPGDDSKSPSLSFAFFLCMLIRSFFSQIARSLLGLGR